MQRAKHLLGAAAGPYVRQLTRGMGRVLMYHRFGGDDDCRRLHPAVFEQQMVYVKRYFHPISLAEFARKLKSGEPLPEKSVVITLDDGYADCCKIAVPILARHEIPATLFIVSDFIDRRLWLWYDAIRYLVFSTNRDNVSLNLAGGRQALRTGDRNNRDLLWERISEDVFPLPMRQKWERIHELAADLALTLPEVPTAEYEATTWEALCRLDPELFEVGGHTRSHAVLVHCDPSELRIELEGSKKAIEDRLEREVRCFCYPNGQKDDYDEPSIRAVRSAGYECAVVAHGGLVPPHADPYRIERMSPSAALSAFRNEINGIPDLRSRVAARLRR